MDINQFLVSQGYAWADTYYTNAYIKEQEKAQKINWVFGKMIIQ